MPANRPEILWIEDSARYELSELAGPVYHSRKYVLNLAEDATSAVYHLSNKAYDGLIVDIRIPPGDHPTWTRLYQENNRNKDKARLGLHLLEWMLGSNGATGDYPNLGKPPGWVNPAKIAVFTVESYLSIKNSLETLKIDHHYLLKTSARRDTILLDLIDALMDNWNI